MSESLIPFGDEFESLGDDALFAPDLVGIDRAASDGSVSQVQFPAVDDSSHQIIPIAETARRVAFLVTDWLVGEGER
jgi:hypothetical protein